MIVRRVTQRQFLLRPDKASKGIFLYALAYFAKKHGIRITGFIVLSNHEHICIEDPHGNVSVFLTELHSVIARAMNCVRGRFESFWTSERPTLVRLVGAAAVLSKIGYTEANAAAANLVKFAKDWPGATSAGCRAGMKDGVVAFRIKRPKRFFSENMPEEVTLELYKPKEFEHLTDEEWIATVDKEVERRELEAQKKRRGAKCLGAKAVRRQSPFSCPQTCAERFRIKPNVAAKNKWERIAALQQNTEFQIAYRDAYVQWRNGDHDVVFPYGTYKMRVFHGAKCRGPDHPLPTC